MKPVAELVDMRIGRSVRKSCLKGPRHPLQHVAHFWPAVREHRVHHRLQHLGTHVGGARQEEAPELVARLHGAGAHATPRSTSAVVTIFTPRWAQSLRSLLPASAWMARTASVTRESRVFGRCCSSPSTA